MLVDLEFQERENRRLQRSLKAAKLRSNVVLEDIDFHRPRGLDRNQVLNLAESPLGRQSPVDPDRGPDWLR